MGNRNTKSSLRNAIIYLNISADSVSVSDDKFWNQIWSEEVTSTAEIVKSISTQEIRMLRDGSPKNFATLTYKMVERLFSATGTLCNTQSQQTAVLNATRILIRLIPCIFEDKAWRNFFSDNSSHLFNSKSSSSEPELVFPKKSDQEKNYESYLPAGCQLKSSCPIVVERHARSSTSSKSSETFTDREALDRESGPTIDLSEDNNHHHHQNQNQLINDDSEGPTSSSRKEEKVFQRNIKSSLKCSTSSSEQSDRASNTLMKSLVLSICDLLFCPEFTVTPHTDNYLSNVVDVPPEDLKSLVTCDYVWEPGVGFDSNSNSTTYYDKSRSELLRLLLACLSTTLYETPNDSVLNRNQWIEIFTSNDNRHALPLFTSLLNTVFIYNSSKLLPFNHLLFEDTREELVELSIQILIATLDYQFNDEKKNDYRNLFIEYISRIHRNEDFVFLIKGFTRLLNSRLEQGYLLSSTKHINFDQELLILFWKICNLNKKFICFLLKTTDILNIVLPILYHLNENFQDTTKTALIHIGVFNLLILSGERNFGVRLNKPYLSNVLLNLPAFTGSHADLMIIVFHKLILYGQNINQLFDFLLTIIVNISPYLKALSMLASKCLIQLFEIFSSSCVIFTEPNYHQLVIFLLEIFNNLIQYQFDGNANLVFTILNKREAFKNLANLPTTAAGIQRVLNKLIKKKHKHRIMLEQMNAQDQQQSKNQSEVNSDRQQSSADVDYSKCEKGANSRLLGTATISSNLARPFKLALNQLVTKQEVSLVATPDICHVTQPIHPFINIENHSNPEIFFATTPSVDTPPLSFDDILNDQIETDLITPRIVIASTSSIEDTTTNNSDNNGSNGKTNGIEIQDDDTAEGSSRPLLKHHSQSIDDGDDDGGRNRLTNMRSEFEMVSCSNRNNDRWRPTPDWVKLFKQSLPLHTTLRMIEVLTPQLDRFSGNRTSNDGNKQLDEVEAIKFLQNGTLVGLLPVPHPILIRKYRTNRGTTLWFRACTWGIIYVRNTIWTDTVIKLIQIV